MAGADWQAGPPAGSRRLAGRLAPAAWSLGQIGRHSPDHAKFLAEADVPSRLLAVYMLPESSKDLKDKAKKALKYIIRMCTHLPALEPLLQLKCDFWQTAL